MRRTKAPVLAALLCVGLLVAGVLVYESGNHRLAGAILAVALIGTGLLIAPVMSPTGTRGEIEGISGRRVDVTGFDRPRDQSGI